MEEVSSFYMDLAFCFEEAWILSEQAEAPLLAGVSKDVSAILVRSHGTTSIMSNYTPSSNKVSLVRRATEDSAPSE